MSTRTTSKTDTFTRPHHISGVDDIQPPSAHRDGEEIDGLTFLAWRTTVTVVRDGKTTFFRIDPFELDVSLVRDAGARNHPSGPYQRSSLTAACVCRPKTAIASASRSGDR